MSELEIKIHEEENPQHLRQVHAKERRKKLRSHNSFQKAAFYGEERPTFLNGYIIKSSGVSIPELSNSYVISRDGNATKTDSGNACEDQSDDFLYQQKYTGSHRFDIGTAQTIGKRTYMEDTVMIRGALFDDVDYIAVFDGHNGKDAAIKCMETMHTLIEKDLILSDEYDDHLINVFERMHDIVCEATPSGTTASLVILRNDDIIT